MATAARKSPKVLDENCDDPVLLQTEDEDRFFRTQREVVGAVRSADDLLARSREWSKHFRTMIDDLRAKCATTKDVAKCVLAPRVDDILVVVVAKGEDEEGVLDDFVSAWDLEMFGQNRFRLSWLMLRGSEAHGLGSFVDPALARTLYSAD